MGGLAEMFGTQNDFEAKAPEINQGNLTYGTGGEQQRQQTMGERGQARQAPGLQLTDAHQDRAASYAARDSQGDALGMMRGAALGTAPSAADFQMRQGIDQALANQYAAAAGARGAGVAGAQREAAYAGGEMALQANVAGQARRADEQARAREAYGSMATQQRMSDLQQQGLSYQEAFQRAQLEQQNREANDRYQLGLEGLSNQIGLGQLQAGVAGEGLRQQGSLGAQGINAGVAAGNQAADQAATGMAVGAAAGVATGGMSIAAQQGASAAGGRKPF
jgi:hypothetical protein